MTNITIEDSPGIQKDEEKRGAIRQPRHLDRGWCSLLFPSRLSLLISLFTCVLAPLSLVALHIHENPMFSPIDEAAHYDYVTRIADGSVPRLGQRLESSTLRDLSCIGTALPGMVVPTCGSRHLKPNEYPGGGYQYEAQQPPTYYAVTVPLRWIGAHVLGLSDLAAARAAGAVWLIAGLLMLWTAGRIVGLSPNTVGIGALLVATAPLVIYQTATVSNDVPSVFVGCLLALLAALVWRHYGRWAPPTLFAAGAVVGSIKATDALPVVVVAALLGILAWQHVKVSADRRAAPFAVLVRWSPNGGLLLLGCLLSVGAWIFISRDISLINPKTLPTFNVLRTHPVGLSLIAREALTMFGPATDSYLAFRSNASATVAASGELSMNVQQIMSAILQYILIAGGAAGLFVVRRTWSHWMGLLTLPVLYLGGVILGVGLWLTYNTDPGIQGRYGLALAPFLVAALIGSVRGRWVIASLALFALASFGLSIAYIVVA